jgi:ribosomal protein S18 acetylase RimI-like enzyme
MKRITQLDITDWALAEQVLKVQLPAYRVEADLIGFDGIPALKDTVQTLAACGETFMGYFEEGGLAGAVSYKEMPPVDGEPIIIDIHRLVVHPAFFRKGIGTALLRHLLDQYEKRAALFIVRTGARNIPAKLLYTGMGFVDMGDMEVAPGIMLTRLEKHC